MSEKLFALCQLQLDSIVDDLDASVGGVNAAAARMLEGFRAYEEKGEDAQSADAGAELANTVGSEIRNIIMGLQFHDELNQRLQHVQDLLHLLQDQEQKADQHDTEKLLKRLSKIFSSHAEFNQLRKVFPGCHVASSSETVELF